MCLRGLRLPAGGWRWKGDSASEVPNCDEPDRIVGGDEHTWLRRLLQPDSGSNATLEWTVTWQGELEMTKMATLSDDELRKRRATILERLGVSVEELRERAERYTLVGDEHEAWEQLESIAFLLGENRA